MKLVCRDHTLSLDHMAIMGILNVTPDSFSDGGRWLDEDKAVRHALDMVEQGAQIIDVGGESTRPGATPVPESEELARVIPVVVRLARETEVPVSIDTRKPSVATAAIEAGASVVNDTTGEADTAAMDDIVSAAGAAVVVMHSRGTPQTMTSLTDYEDVVVDVRRWLESRLDELLNAGVAGDSIVLDPGLGFAKTFEQNLLLLNRLDEITALPSPVLVGSSRKSFIGRVLGTEENEREEGTIATVLWAQAKGARVTRVHRVDGIRRAVRMAEAIGDARS
jgi:dihydropteroate synthase